MAQGPHAEIISPYFMHMRALLNGGLILGDVQVKTLKKTRAKTLYEGFTSSFPPPKIVFKFDFDWSQVWLRLQSPMLEPGAREVMFMVVHNIIANRDRLFSKFHMVPNADCLHCNVLHDNVHVFCECVLVRESWFWIRQRLIGMIPHSGATSNFEFLNLMFEKSAFENQVIWMIGIHVQMVWEHVICKKKSLKIETLKSEYRMKFVEHQKSNMPDLGCIVGLLD